jgi:Domain of Unknown Function (DUF1206)
MARTSGRAAQTWNNMADSSWLELIARFGYSAVGVLYLLIGLLALKLAVGTESRAPDAQRVIVRIGGQPYGKVLLGIIAGGLLAFAIWRAIQAISDPYEVGRGLKGMATRAGYILSGLIYGTLAIFGTGLIWGATRDGGSTRSMHNLTARVLSEPLGAWVLGIVGAGIIVGGLVQFFQVYTAQFAEHFTTLALSGDHKRFTTHVGRWGCMGCGVVACVIGTFVLRAATRSDSRQTRGLAGALDALAQLPYGSWVLGLVAIGLAAYGLFMLTVARYGDLKA